MVPQTIDCVYVVASHEAVDWRTRALQLAESHGLARTGRGVYVAYDAPDALDATGVPTALVVRVASQSQVDVDYDVIYTLATDTAQCACTAARYGRPCGHAGEAIRYGRYVKALFTRAAQAEAARMAARDVAHEQNAGNAARG